MRWPASGIQSIGILERRGWPDKPGGRSGRNTADENAQLSVCRCSAPLVSSTKAQIPKPQGTEVLLKMLAAGVCHSDLHIWDGYYELGGGKKLMLTSSAASSCR